jgi:hypothetical protein
MKLILENIYKGQRTLFSVSITSFMFGAWQDNLKAGAFCFCLLLTLDVLNERE